MPLSHRKDSGSESSGKNQERSNTQTRSLQWHQIPHWQRDNEYIIRDYRPVAGSLIKCLHSLGYVHNETINIYSHLLGSALFASLPFYTYQKVFSQSTLWETTEMVVFLTFFFGVAICFLLSAAFHTISNHSKEYAAFGNQLDYLGVVVLMWGSTLPTVYYGFYCDPKLQRRYWTMISILAFACALTTMHPKFRHPSIRAYRAAMFAGLGLSALVFTIHGILIYGWHTQKLRMSLDYMLLMATLNLIGAAIYAARIPEKFFPNKFDVVGSSHQILHIMVILAGLAHFKGLLRAFDTVHSNEVPCMSDNMSFWGL